MAGYTICHYIITSHSVEDRSAVFWKRWWGKSRWTAA